MLIEPRIHTDGRGSFHEVWHAGKYSLLGLTAGFVQCNVSRSKRGVLRGLHLQQPEAQAKLIAVMQGQIFDVAVDVRRGSPTWGRWFGATLSATNGRQLFIPEGFAHGLLSQSDDTVVTYLVTRPYHPGCELVIRWDDPAIAIEWPGQPATLSSRDRDAPRLADLIDRLPEYVP